MMNFASSLIKVEKYFCMKVSVRVLEYMQKVQAVSTRECIKLMSKTAEGLQSVKYSLLQYPKNPEVGPNGCGTGDPLKFFIDSVANHQNI